MSLSSLRSQAGLGIVEILVGSVIIVFLALASGIYGSIMMSDKRSGYGTRFNCNAHLNSVLSKLRSEIGATNVPIYHPHGSLRQPQSLFQYPQVLPTSQLWAGVPEMMSGHDVPIVANSLVVGSPVRVFNAMYNSTSPDFCGAFRTTTELQNLALESAQLISDQPNTSVPTTSLRLRLYNLNTGAIEGCGLRPVWIFPQGLTPNQPNLNGFAAGSPFFRRPTNYRNDLGILVEAQTQYQERRDDGTLQNRTCALAERVYYERDTQRPVTPIVQVTSAPTPPDGGNAHQNSVSLRITYPAVGEKGVVLVCRDRSTLMPPGGEECYSAGGGPGAGPGPQWVGGQRSAPLPAITETDAGIHQGSSRPSAWPSPNWVPCERVTVCGRLPASATRPDPNSSGIIEFNNTYNNVRSECIMRVEAVAMDTAGNLHNYPYASFNPSQISSSAAATATATQRPTCGQTCNYAGQSYFQVGACCVGLGCGRGMVGSPSGPQLSLSTDPPL